MSKEMLEQANEWLRSMYDLLSLKTDEEDRAYTQKRIDLFKWLIKQAEQVQELEELNRILSSDKSMFIEELVREQQQNKRYREMLEEIARGRFPGASYKARKALEGEK